MYAYVRVRSHRLEGLCNCDNDVLRCDDFSEEVYVDPYDITQLTEFDVKVIIDGWLDTVIDYLLKHHKDRLIERLNVS